MKDDITAWLWRKTLSVESQFCKAVVAAGYLSEQQMQHAARRYRLGATLQGGVIFWQIDHRQRVHNGKVMYYRPDCHRNKQRNPTWVSAMLQRRYHWPDRPQGSHCLFGLHLISPSKIGLPTNSPPKIGGARGSMIAVVEAEKSAVILSELFPDYLWLATGGLGEVQTEKFRPLRGRRVILFPDTDPDGTAFRRWSDAAQQVQRQLWWEDSPPITVSPFLELRATPEQKARKIDLVDYLFPAH